MEPTAGCQYDYVTCVEKNVLHQVPSLSQVFLKSIFAFRALDSLENFSQLVSVWTGATQFYGSLFHIAGESLKSLFHLIMFNMI